MQTVWTVNAKRRGFTVLAVSTIHVELSRAPVASSYLSVSTAKYKSHVSVNSGGVDCRDWFLVWSRAAVVFTPAPISHCCLWPKQQLLIFLFFIATCMRCSQHAFVIKVHRLQHDFIFRGFESSQISRCFADKNSFIWNAYIWNESVCQPNNRQSLALINPRSSVFRLSRVVSIR